MESSPELKEMIIRTQGLMPVKEDSVINDWKNCEATEEGQGRFASHYFHNCTLDDVGRITLYRTIAEADGDADVFECMTLFRCDRGKALCINRAIGSFDTLLPQKCKRNKIPATQLFVFMKWCSGSIGYNTFLGYFNKHYKGLHGIISSPSALAGAAKKLQKTSDVYKDMMEKLQKMFPEVQAKKIA